MRTKYDDMGETAAEEYINEGKPLTESVRDIVKENSLNKEEAKRVVEGANKRTFLNIFKEADGDATFTFDLVDPEQVVGEASEVKEASYTGDGNFEKQASSNSSIDDFSFSPRDHRNDKTFKQVESAINQHNKEAKSRQNELEEKSMLKKASVRADDFISKKESELYNLSFEGDDYKNNIKESAYDLLKEGYSKSDIEYTVKMTDNVSDETKKIANLVLKEAFDERATEIAEWRDSKKVANKQSGNVINQDNPISNNMVEIDKWAENVKQAKKEKQIAEEVKEEIENQLNE